MEKLERLYFTINGTVDEWRLSYYEDMGWRYTKGSISLKEINNKNIKINFKSKILETIPFSWIIELNEDSRSKLLTLLAVYYNCNWNYCNFGNVCIKQHLKPQKCSVMNVIVA